VSDPDFLSKLNPEQREAVLHEKGPLLVLAGAGSGKTRVITHRLARLVRSGTDPRTIAAVTFTNKAAGEMRERAQALAGGAALGSFVGTFHSWCLRFLRRRYREANLPPRFSIADSSDQLSLVKEAMEELGISTDMLPANSVRSRISSAKNALVSVERFTAQQTDFAGERTARIYALYEKKLAASGALDFDDLIGRSVRLLSSNAAVAAEERRRLRHLLIDEYQDTNSSQDALVKLLGMESDSLCAVGDEDQSIYRWRGAEIEHILRFEEDFPGARVIALESNYRSTAKILAAASGVVSHNRRRREKRLRADRGDGNAVRLWRFEEDRTEVEAVARELVHRGVFAFAGHAEIEHPRGHRRTVDKEHDRPRRLARLGRADPLAKHPQGNVALLGPVFVAPDFAALGSNRRRSLRRHRRGRRYAKTETFENRAPRHPIFGIRHRFIPASHSTSHFLREV